MSGILLTAGYDRSLHSIAVADGLRSLGTPPSMILIAYPMTLTRIRFILKNRGASAILRYLWRKKDDLNSGSPLLDFTVKAGIKHRSLRTWARQWNIPCFSVGNINGNTAVRQIRTLDPTVTAYTGGGILKKSFLEAAGRCVLNAHSGPLPAIRGMNACEWSLLLAEPLSVTLHLIDDGIDTGEIIEKIAILPHRGDSIKILRERCVIAGVKAIVKHAHLALHKVPVTQENCADARQRQCFVMSPALRELLCARFPELIEQQLKRQ